LPICQQFGYTNWVAKRLTISSGFFFPCEQYKPKQLKEALKEVTNSTDSANITKSAKKYNIPQSTLRDTIKHPQKLHKIIPTLFLSNDEVDFIFNRQFNKIIFY
jgi:hypothetical protein